MCFYQPSLPLSTWAPSSQNPLSKILGLKQLYANKD